MTDTKQAVRELREALAEYDEDLSHPPRRFASTCATHLPVVLDRLEELEAIVSRPSSRYCNMAECAKERATLTAERDVALVLLGTIATHEEGSAGE